MLLEDRVVVITGAGRGIGRAEALRCAEEGARVVVNDLGCARDGTGYDEAPAREVVAAIEARGGRAVASFDDVRTSEGAERLVATAVATFGGLDGLINNAAIVRDAGALKLDDETFDAVLEGLLGSSLRVSRAAARQMVAQRRGGHIVMTTSTVGFTGNFQQSNLAAASAGVYGLARALALELKKHNIRVNMLAPTARTRLNEDLPMFGPGGLTEATYGPQFVAPAAVFLLSHLCGELTGEALSVAGTRLTTWAMRESFGVVGDDPKTPWSPEAIAAQWDAISRSR